MARPYVESMTTNALPNHQPATLKAYGKRLVRAACSALTEDATDDAVACMQSAANALRQAARCHHGASRDYAVYAANHLNSARDSLNRMLAGRGKALFTFTVTGKTAAEESDPVTNDRRLALGLPTR